MKYMRSLTLLIVLLSIMPTLAMQQQNSSYWWYCTIEKKPQLVYRLLNNENNTWETKNLHANQDDHALFILGNQTKYISLLTKVLNFVTFSDVPYTDITQYDLGCFIGFNNSTKIMERITSSGMHNFNKFDRSWYSCDKQTKLKNINHNNCFYTIHCKKAYNHPCTLSLSLDSTIAIGATYDNRVDWILSCNAMPVYTIYTTIFNSNNNTLTLIARRELKIKCNEINLNTIDQFFVNGTRIFIILKNGHIYQIKTREVDAHFSKFDNLYDTLIYYKTN